MNEEMIWKLKLNSKLNKSSNKIRQLENDLFWNEEFKFLLVYFDVNQI